MESQTGSPHDAPQQAEGGQPVADGDVPNPETGAGIGAGEPSTFEPEEDPTPQQPAEE